MLDGSKASEPGLEAQLRVVHFQPQRRQLAGQAEQREALKLGAGAQLEERCAAPRHHHAAGEAHADGAIGDNAGQLRPGGDGRG